MKVCTACGETKAFDAFAKHKAGAGGLRPTCRACCRAAGRLYREANRDRRRATAAAYRAENREALRQKDAAYREANREKERARGAAWRAANPERERARSARYRAENKAKDAARKAAYSRANPEIGRAIQARRRARKLGVGGSFGPSDVAALKKLQRNRCAACRASIAGGHHVDHIVPLKLGGSNGRSNLQLLCPPCNWSKNDAHPVDFMRRRGFLL